jgi:hypothetical protein
MNRAPETRLDVSPRTQVRLEVRSPRGRRAWLVGRDGLRDAGLRSGRPDVVLIGDEVALAAVLGGWLSLGAAAREGQLEALGEPGTIDRLGRLLRAAVAA